jgi:hypothetical protein
MKTISNFFIVLAAAVIVASMIVPNGAIASVGLFIVAGAAASRKRFLNA